LSKNKVTRFSINEVLDIINYLIGRLFAT